MGLTKAFQATAAEQGLEVVAVESFADGAVDAALITETLSGIHEIKDLLQERNHK